MPLLPKGSTYTGYDKGFKLIQNAKELFSNSPFKAEFFKRDLLQEEI